MTRPLSPAEQLAEVPPVRIEQRLAELMRSLTLLVDNSLVSVIATDEVFSASQELLDMLGSMVESAERHRSLGESRG